jgi:co-chaperonin GroES (HSP10)|tara:strand:+ start:739 stop:1146 length:408 start_codon:yes stop_codon:yes gene_type:complete
MRVIEGTLKPIKNRVLVSDMFFGEQKTKSGLIIRDDDGGTRGIYPRWGKVYAIGPDNKDPINVGEWVLVEHGRWTRSVTLKNGEEELEIRMVEAESILATADEKPNDLRIGNEYGSGEVDVRPEDFANAHGQMNQ